MDLFDGQGVEFHHLQRMQQVNAQNKTNQILQAAAQAEALKPQCPHCGGRLPGRFDLCANCNRPLYWGHDSTHHPFKTSAEAQQDRAAVAQQLQEAAAAQARQDAEFQATCDRHGVIVRFPALGITGICVAIAWAAYQGGQYLFQPDPSRIARLWEIGAVACLSVSSLVGVAIPPLALIVVFLGEAGCMAYYGMPAWVWSIPLVAAVTELFSKGVGQLLTHSNDTVSPNVQREYLLAKQKQEQQSRELQKKPVQKQQTPERRVVQGSGGVVQSTRAAGLPSLTCPRCKGAMTMPSMTVSQVTCPACGGVFKTRRQAAT
jgi:hypothetical protein